jgi:hypothetical protein
MLREMFTMPAGEQTHHVEGSSEDNPIRLLVGAEPEFDIFVAQAYGMYVAKLFQRCSLLTMFLSDCIPDSTLQSPISLYSSIHSNSAVT